MTELTAKQEKFCQEYMVDLNAAQAAIRAGYSEDSARFIGHENLTKPYIAERIAEMKQEATDRTQITADYVLSSLKEVAERCLQATPVYARGEDSEEPEAEEWKFEHAGANKALELLGKHLGLFVEKKEISGPDGNPLQIQEVQRTIVDTQNPDS